LTSSGESLDSYLDIPEERFSRNLDLDHKSDLSGSASDETLGDRNYYLQTELSDEGGFKADLTGKTGGIRLHKVKSFLQGRFYDRDVSQEDIGRLIDVYKQWVDYDEFIHLDKKTIGFDPERFKTTEVNNDVLLKSAKRGNEKYRYKVQNRLNGLIDLIEGYHGNNGFNPEDSTNALLITLTCDIDKFDSTGEAWDKIGKDWNSYITALREKYGKISYVRVFEAYQNTYPHIHAMLVFHDKEFSTWEQIKKEKGEVKRRTRIDEKSEFEHWHSFVDVEGCRHLGKSLNYVLKYIFKSADTDKHTFTQAIQWLFRKRSYAISRDFEEWLSDLIQIRSNSKLDNTGLTVLEVDFEFKGCVPARFIDRFDNYIEIGKLRDKELGQKIKNFYDLVSSKSRGGVKR